MFRFLENLVDPYQPYAELDAPPTRLWPCLRDYVRAFRKVFAVTAVFSIGTGVLDIGLIWYLGRLVDLMTGLTPQAFLAAHWVEICVVAFVVVFIRPLVAGGAPHGAAAATSSAQFPLPGWPLFRLGFRPFYLGAAAFALFAVPYFDPPVLALAWVPMAGLMQVLARLRRWRRPPQP